LRDALVEACAEPGRGSSGDLLLLPAEAKDLTTERWLKGAAAEQKPPTASENFRLALDPMKGLSGGIDQLLPGAVQPNANAAQLSDTTEYGARKQGVSYAPSEDDAAPAGSVSGDRWRQPDYSPTAPATATSGAAPASPPVPAKLSTASADADLSALKKLPSAPLINSGAAGEPAASAARGQDAHSPANARQSLRSRELAAPKSHPMIMILAVLVIFAAVIVGTNFLLHHNDAPPTQADQPGKTDATTPSENTDTTETQTQGQKNNPTAVDNHVNHTVAPNLAEHSAPHSVHKAAHVPKPHPANVQASHPSAAPVRHAPQAVSQPAATHAPGAKASGKSNPWDALQNMRK